MRATFLALAAVAAAACGGGSTNSGGGGSGSGGSGGSDGGGGGPAQHALTLDVTGSGQIVGAGQACSGHCVLQVTAGALHLDATAAAGWHFAAWSTTCSAAACDLNLTGPLALAVTFAQDAVPPTMRTLTVTTTGSGTVASTPAGINCPGTCSSRFADGTAVSLAATPGSGMSFGGFAGACSGATCALTLGADANVTATFSALPPPPPDECAGLMPAALPAPAGVDISDGSFACRSGTTDDGQGNFGLAYADTQSPYAPLVRFYSAANGHATELSGYSFENKGQFALFSQPSGFSVWHTDEGASKRSLTVIDHQGQALSTLTLDSGPVLGSRTFGTVGLDPSGGLAIARAYLQTDGASNYYVTTYQRMEKTYNFSNETVIDRTGLNPAVAVGVSLSGDVLVVEIPGAGKPAGAPYRARWLARDGTALTNVFEVDNTTVSLSFLLDGSLLERSYGGMTRVFPDGKANTAPLPAWLEARKSSAGPFAIRGGKGYAMAGTPQCAGAEVLSPSGNSCGCLAVQNASPQATVGRDGSLIVPHQAGPNSCHYDLYPQLFK